MEAVQIIVLAIVVEAVWETLKMAWQDGKFSVDKIGVLVLGLVVAVVYQLDVLAMLNVTDGFHIVGAILTGILISRGGNYVHDIVNRLTKGSVDTLPLEGFVALPSEPTSGEVPQEDAVEEEPAQLDTLEDEQQKGE